VTFGARSFKENWWKNESQVRAISAITFSLAVRVCKGDVCVVVFLAWLGVKFIVSKMEIMPNKMVF
jgi:hypothetical protein